jgi:hypothetical protein
MTTDGQWRNEKVEDHLILPSMFSGRKKKKRTQSDDSKDRTRSDQRKPDSRYKRQYFGNSIFDKRRLCCQDKMVKKIH